LFPLVDCDMADSVGDGGWDFGVMGGGGGVGVRSNSISVFLKSG